MFFTLSKGTLLLIFVLGLPVFLDAEYILKLWLGANIPAYSVELVRLSVIFLLVDKLASPVTALIHATGRVKRYHLLSGIINIMVIPFSWILFSIGYKPTSFYVVTIVGAFVAQIVFLFVIKNLLPFSIKDYLKTVVVPFFVVFALTIWLPLYAEVKMQEGIFRLASVFVLSGIITSITAYCFALTKGEKGLINSLLKNK